MCGRFTLNSTPRRIALRFGLRDQPKLFPRYNIAPSQPVMIVRAAQHSGKPDERETTHVVWGLIPEWSKDPNIGVKMINARSETASFKQGYRGAFKYRRCLVPADGFYEWQRDPHDSKRKQPFYIHMADGEPFAMAGLWEHWQGPGGEEIESCTVLTISPNRLMKPIHDRMPVIIEPKNYSRWLDPKMQDHEAIRDLLCPFDATKMSAMKVGTYVNSTRHEGERCITPIEEAGGEQLGLF